MSYTQTILVKVEDFDGILVRSIHETIVAVLGPRVWDTVFWYLLTKLSVTREELPSHLESLQAVLEKALGPIVTRTMSRAIARRLYAQLNIEFADKPHFHLVDYVAEARNIVSCSQSENITA